MFNYPGDTNGILLQKFVSIIDTFHDFTGSRATGFKPTEGGFNDLWPSGSIAQQKSQRINFNGLSANVILQGNSAFLVQILGRNIYRLAKDDGAASIVRGQNTRSNINSMRKLSHLLYFFANVMGGTKDLIGKCEEYASELLSKTGKIVEKDQICNQLNTDGKHAIVIDIFSTGGRNCIKERSVIHGVGVMDPAPRAGKAWKEVFEEVGSRCVGRGTKGFPVTFEFDKLDEDRVVRLHLEYKRQLAEINGMKGNITTTNSKSVNMNAEKQFKKINNKRSLGNAVGNKRTRNNNNNVNATKRVKPTLTTAATGAAKAMNAINRKSVGDKRTRNNNNDVKTVKRVKPTSTTAVNVINLTNNNRSLAQLAEQNKRYYQQMMKIKRDLERYDKMSRSSSTSVRLRAYRKQVQLTREQKRLRMLRHEGFAAYYKKRAQTGDNVKELNARKIAARLKNELAK